MHAFEAEHVADFVWVWIDADGAVRDNGACVFADTEHGRFDVNVAIEETWSDILAFSIDDLGIWTDAGSGITDQSNAPFLDGNVEAVKDFCRADIDQTAVADDRICWHTAHSGISECFCDFPERTFAKMIDHDNPLPILVMKRETVAVEIKEAFLAHL